MFLHKSIYTPVVFASLSLTLFIESIQGFIPYRFCEIDDVWLNTLGGFLGSYIYIKFINYFRNLKRDDQS